MKLARPIIANFWLYNTVEFCIHSYFFYAVVLVVSYFFSAVKEICNILMLKKKNCCIGLCAVKIWTWRFYITFSNDMILFSDLSCSATFKRLVKTEVYNHAYFRCLVTIRTYDSSLCGSNNNNITSSLFMLLVWDIPRQSNMTVNCFIFRL